MEDEIVQPAPATDEAPAQDPTTQDNPAPQETPAQDPQPKADRTQDLIAKARQEEKNKLYPQIKALEDENKSLKDQLAERDTQIAALQSELTEVKANMDENEKNNLDANALVEQMKAEFKAELDRRDAQAAEDKRKADLALLRQQLIHEANGAIIPELVKGESEDEVRQSVEASKAKYAEIATAAAEAAKAQTQQTPAAPLVNHSQVPAQGAALDLTNVRSVNDADWAKNRRQAMEAAAATLRVTTQQ